MEEPEQAPPPPGAVVFTSVPAQDALVCHVLRTVRAWFQGGVALHDMAVVLPPSGAFVGSMRPERLGPTLVRALGEAGVPCHTLSGAPLIEHTHGRRLLGVLQLAGQLAALKAPTAGHLFDEAGINVALWAGGVQWSGEVTDCEAGPLAALAQANLLRRCGHRRLGPYALRRALRALRNVPAAVAEATAAAAEAWLARWVLPLCGGDRPLGERVRHLGQLLAHVTERSDGPEALDVMPVAQALQALADSGDAFGIHTSLTEAYGWVSGVLAEQRGRRHQTGPIGGVPILAAQDMVGRRFSHVLALGLNNVPYGPTTGPLSEVLRKEINQALGYKLLQYGAVTGRAPLPLGAQAQFYFTELLRSTQTHLHGVIVKLADEELSAPSQEAERLLQAAAVVPVDVPNGARGPWYQEQTPALALRRLVSSEGLPWALEQAPDDARLRALARGAQMLGPSAQGPRPPLSLATTAQLQGGMIGQVHGVSSLDQLAMCRYRYFAGPLLGLSHEPHPEHHIDRRRAGEAAHRALYQIYSALLAQRPWPHWQAHPDAAQRLAHQTFAAQQAVILPATWVHDDLRQGALAVVWHSVAAQLRRDLAQSVGEPAALEYRFGDPVRTDHPALKVQHPQDPTRHLFVRGTIDRVDRDPARLHVIDYKSTLPSRQPDRHFQLGLYQAVAVRDLLPQAERIEATWLLLGQPASGPVQRQPKELSGSPADVLGQTFAALWARLDAVLAGTVAPDPAPAAVCSHCDFIKLCRYRPETDAQLDLDALDGAEGAA
jgi:RecB family exonuclease